MRWGSLLACTAARAVAASLLELPFAQGADRDTPAPHEVERDRLAIRNLTDFGQNLGGRLWPNRLWPNLVF